MSIDFGYASHTIRLPFLSARLPVRVLAVSSLLFLLALVLGTVSTTLGEYPLHLGEVLDALAGRGPAFQQTVVLEWRLPVALSAVVFGALLGVGGAIFQSLTRNPLGSPDVIGFDAGSYTAVVITIVLLGSADYWTIAAASMLGGLATALLVYLLAWRRGVHGFRLIIVGIAVTAVLGSLNAYLITRADLEDAMTVGFWGAGSLNRITWAGATGSFLLAAPVFVAAALLSSPLQRLELGDDTAITQGTRVQPVRLALLVVGVATTAIVTAAAGPIGFIALVAPQLARRLTGSAGVSLVSAAAMGACLLSAAQVASQLIAVAHRPFPVGLITVCLGGGYLIWLLVKEARNHPEKLT